MTRIVQIGSASLDVLEFEGQRVVTLAMMDKVHQRPEGTARKRYNDHKDRLVEGEDYFVRNSDEAREMGHIAPNGLVLLAESGYLMVVKSFTDDLAWDVQRKLVRSYFRPAAIAIPRTLSEALRFAADEADARAKAEQERDHAVATKALIGSKREATAMNTAAQRSREAAKLRDQLGFSARHATVLQVESAMGRDFAWHPLRKYCKEHGLAVEVVPDKRFPNGVKAWPAKAWATVYEVSLEELFGEEVAA